MEDTRTMVCARMDLALAPRVAFEVLIEELATALLQGGMGLEAGPQGRVTEGAREVGHVVSWQPGELVRLQWHQADWKPKEVTDLEVRLEPVDGGTRVTLEHRG